MLIVASVALALTPGRPREEHGLGVVASEGTVRSAKPRGSRTKGGARPARAKRQGSFLQRLEQRWEHRRQQGQGW